MKKYITTSGSASMGVSTVFGTGKKSIWDLGLSRSPGNKFLRPFESKYGHCIFQYELFSFCEKVLSAFDHAGFFSKYFTAPHPFNPNDIFYWLLLVENRTMQIKLTPALLKEPTNLL